MPDEDPKYPMVMCEEHGVQRSYIVCGHVMAGAEPVNIVLASDTEIGEILCGLEHGDMSDFKILCEEHCQRWLK